VQESEQIFDDSPIVKNLTRLDKKILKYFIGLYIGLIVIVTIPFIIYFRPNFDQILSGFYSSYVFTCLIIGIYVFINYRKRGLIPLKRILVLFTKLAVIVSPALTMVIYFVAVTEDPDPELAIGTPVFFTMVIIVNFAMILAVVLALFIIMIFALAMMGILSAIIRGITPEILLHVSRITPNVIKSAKSPEAKKRMVYSILSWLYCIPEELDSRTLRINRGKPVKHFPWSSLYKALWWQFLFGVVVIVYISLNPLYLGDMSFQRLFNIASNITSKFQHRFVSQVLLT